jgi:cation transport protein ChaC
VTLVSVPGSECWGVAYRVREEQRAQVAALLEVREKGGYELLELPFEARSRGSGPPKVQVYLGHGHNPQFVGPEEEAMTAAIIRESEGPSGHNVEYLLRLAEALTDMDVLDAHVLRLANLIIDPADVLLEG